MDTWTAITSRRNVRSYKDKPIPSDVLERIVQAGWLAPSASNRQHRDFILVTDKSKLAELASVWQGARHVPGSAATVAITVPVPESERDAELDAYDVGQATILMMLAAADAGVGSGHSSVGDQDAARRILGFPDNVVLKYLIAFGYPDDRPLAPYKRINRRPIEEVVHRESW